MAKKVLLGLHNDLVMGSTERVCTHMGWDFVSKDNPEDFLEELRKSEYNAYIMDINLGRPAQVYTEPAENAFELIRQRYKEGLCKFIAISGTPEAVRLAREKGIPVKSLSHFKPYEFLGSEK